jgi:hypothetical protein
LFRLAITDMNKTMKKTKSNSAYPQESTPGKRNSIISLHDKERDYASKMIMKPGAKVQLCYMRGGVGKKESTILCGNNN